MQENCLELDLGGGMKFNGIGHLIARVDRD